MDTGILAVLLAATGLFLLVLAVAWLVNKAMGRPSINGAAIFFWLFLAANVALHVYVVMSPDVTAHGARHAGKTTGYGLPLLLLAFFMARSFRKRKARHLSK